MAELTAKQRLFVDEYFKQGMNLTRAAIAAGYSRATARQQGSRLLTNVDVKSEVERRLKENAMSANEVVARLTRHARGSMADFLNVIDGANVPLVDWEQAQANGDLDLIKEIEIEDGKLRFKLYDVQAALVQLGRFHSLFVDKQDITSGGEKLTAIAVVKMPVDEL